MFDNIFSNFRLSNTCLLKKTLINFVFAYRLQTAIGRDENLFESIPIWVMWVGADILESVYLRSFLTIRNLENFNWSQG